MGIKEFEHLKKSLSEIKSKSSRIKNLEDKLSELNQDKMRLKKQINNYDKESLPAEMSRIQKQENEFVNTGGLSKEEKTHLSEIQQEYKMINQRIINSGKVIKKETNPNLLNYAICVFVIWLALPIGGAIIGANNETNLFFLYLDNDDFFVCDNGEEIPYRFVNDEILDCDDGSDEGIPITDELIQKIASSKDTKDQVINYYCFLLPIFLILIGILLAGVSSQTGLVDGKTRTRLTEIKRIENRLRQKSIEYEKQIHDYSIQKQNIQYIEKLLVKDEFALTQTNSDINNTILEVNNLEESIEETYESIKHLIPYSEYL